MNPRDYPISAFAAAILLIGILGAILVNWLFGV